ncbi:hypothetical protein N3K66_006806 [Trichothecium roseum]|uniref:Uncharacterized protein n=1 Tax=Trichothecium roseum TaxID=47278 RepID=A0ACC0UWE2_9HYPO|nr:hypothetical protein N3K66_006806 [Trichothecium roseum]
MLLRKAGLLSGLLASTVNGIDFDPKDKDVITEATGTVAYGLLGFYYGNNTGDVPGNLPDPYYWWVCGAMFGTLIDYWRYIGDDTYNDLIMQGMMHQVGQYKDYMPSNQTLSMGNDDQGFWALTAMAAAEAVFPNPPDDQPQWIQLASTVWNLWAGRWDPKNCGGGLRWQVYPTSPGYNYKNSISNGLMFDLGARLARYTGNKTYIEWVEKIWDWEEKVGLVTDKFEVKDGVTIRGDNCKDMDKTEWTYNLGLFLHGSAVMYDVTEDEKWKTRTKGFLDSGIKKFTKDGVLFEQFCEPFEICNMDQKSFKGYLARWMAATVQLIPEFYDTVHPVISKSAVAASKACVGNPTEPLPMHPAWRGHPNTACGFKWTTGQFDNSYGVGEQMSALSVMMYVLADSADPPVTNTTGGKSHGDPGSGVNDDDRLKQFPDITTSDRVGAGFLTTFILAAIIGGCAFVSLPLFESH